jgi:hypothetical protein
MSWLSFPSSSASTVLKSLHVKQKFKTSLTVFVMVLGKLLSLLGQLLLLPVNCGLQSGHLIFV